MIEHSSNLDVSSEFWKKEVTDFLSTIMINFDKT